MSSAASATRPNTLDAWQAVRLLGAVLTGDAGRCDLPAAAGAPRIGLCRTPDWPQADADTVQAWDLACAALAPQAAAPVDTDLPADLPDLVALQQAVMAFEMARALAPERRARRPGLSAPTR